MTIKKTRSLIMGLLAISNTTFAMKLIPSNSSNYYKIGGASNLLVPAVSSVKKMKLGANIKAQLFPSCSNFNPVVSIKNSFNNIEKSFVGLESNMIANTTAAIHGYALAKIKQTMPDTFDSMLSQNKYIGAEFKYKKKTCEEFEKQIAKGDSPIDGLFELSDTQGWVDAAKRAKHENVDVVSEEQKITQNRETYGVPWIHRNEYDGYAGGKNQKPIKVISDVVIAGYNIIASEPGSVALDSIAPPIGSHANFVRFWPDPKAASSWATKVLGDISFTKDDEKKNTESGDVVAGIGLAAMLQSCPDGSNANTCPKDVSALIWQMIDSNTDVDISDLERLNSGGMAVSFEVIHTIKNMDRSDQIIAVSKLSQDIAMQNLIEEALALRRILLAGFQVQEVQNLKPVRTTVKNTIALLDKEIESLAFENKIRRELTNKTLSTILEIRDEAMAKANAPGSQNSDHIANGALYTKNGGDK